MADNLLEKIKAVKDTLPKRQRMLCEYICDNVFEVSTLTINELAKQGGVGTTTVIRTMQTLGYESYIQFKNELQEIAVDQAKVSYNVFLATYWDSMRNPGKEKGAGDISSIPSMVMVCESMMKRINDPQFLQQLLKGVELIRKADKVYVLGLRGSYPLSMYMEMQLAQHKIPLSNLGDRPDLIYDRLVDMTEEDLLVAIALNPVAELTVRAVDICRDRGIPILMITNSTSNSFLEGSAAAISLDFGTFVTSVPVIVAIELLCQEVGRRSIEVTTERLQMIEKLMQQYGVVAWRRED